MLNTNTLGVKTVRGQSDATKSFDITIKDVSTFLYYGLSCMISKLLIALSYLFTILLLTTFALLYTQGIFV